MSISLNISLPIPSHIYQLALAVKYPRRLVYIDQIPSIRTIWLPNRNQCFSFQETCTSAFSFRAFYLHHIPWSVPSIHIPHLESFMHIVSFPFILSPIPFLPLPPSLHLLSLSPVLSSFHLPFKVSKTPQLTKVNILWQTHRRYPPSRPILHRYDGSPP